MGTTNEDGYTHLKFWRANENMREALARIRELESALENILKADYAEECQECGIGHQDCWEQAKAVMAKPKTTQPIAEPYELDGDGAGDQP